MARCNGCRSAGRVPSVRSLPYVYDAIRRLPLSSSATCLIRPFASLAPAIALSESTELPGASDGSFTSCPTQIERNSGGATSLGVDKAQFHQGGRAMNQAITEMSLSLLAQARLW